MLGSLLSRRMSPNKYEFLFDYFYKERLVYVHIDEFSLSTTPYSPIKEFYLWVLVNRLNPIRFRIIKDLDKLKLDDVIISFIYEHFTNLTGDFARPRSVLLEKFKNSKAYKIIHLSHFGYNASLGSRNTKEAGIDLFVSESNLFKNSVFFNEYFSWYQKDVYALPFVPNKKFINFKEFSKRKNKALALGTITYPMADKDFFSFFNDYQLQPMRRYIYDNANQLGKYMDSLITNIADDNAKKGITVSKIKNPAFLTNVFSLSMILKKSLCIKWIKYVIYVKNKLQEKIINAVKSANYLRKISLLILSGKQNKMTNDRPYYQLDIVSKFNEYKMFIVPEEVIGVPGIGFVEGLACGTALLGKRDPMYNDLGLIDKVHYIGYDGTPEDMIDKISYYQNHENELAEIAANGYDFVRVNFSEDKVTKDFINYIEINVKGRVAK
jgi:glycosyltransferase involved in cell wall biosynthesis